MIQFSNPFAKHKRDGALAFLLGALIFTGFTSGLAMEIGTVTLTLSHLFATLLFGYLLLYAFIGRQPVAILYKDDASLFLYLFFLSNLFSSIVFAENRLHAIKGCAAIFVYLLIYTVIRSSIRLMSSQEATLKRFYAFNYLSAAIGLGCMVLSLYMGTENFGVSFGHLSIGTTLGVIPPSIKSLSLEPNLFSIGTAAVLCIGLARYMLDNGSWRELFVVLMLGLAVIFAYTRSVYVALLVSGVVLMILTNRIRVLRKAAAFSGAILVITFLLGIGLPDENPVRIALVERASTLVDFGSGTGYGRMIGYRLALESFLSNPILGKGTFSADTKIFNPYTGVYDERMGSPGWLTGSWIQSLHDTGIVGFVILFSLFGILLRLNYLTFLRLPVGDPSRSIVLGLLGGNIIIILASQLSSPLWTAFPYIYWAINMAFLDYCKMRLEEYAQARDDSK